MKTILITIIAAIMLPATAMACTAAPCTVSVTSQDIVEDMPTGLREWHKTSVQRTSAWDGTTFAPALIVRINGTPHKHFVGNDGLTDAIRWNPAEAAAWASNLYGVKVVPIANSGRASSTSGDECTIVHRSRTSFYW